MPSRLPALILAVIGGLLTDAAFPQRSIWAFAPIGLALLLVAIARASARWAFAVGTVWGLAFFPVHLWWANAAVGVVPWVALSLSQSLLIGAFAASWVVARRGAWLSRHPAAQVMAVGAIFTAWEAVRSAVPFGGFPWGRLAFSQTEGPLLRLASLGGTTLVTFAVAAIGALLALAWAHVRHVSIGRAAGAVLMALALTWGPLVVGLDVRAENGSTRVGVVQGNVANPGLGAFANAREVIGNHVAGTEALAQEVGSGTLDVVLWPENAADYDPRTDPEAGAAVDGAAAAVGAPIMLGTQRYEAGVRFNEVILWEEGVGATRAYAKQRPAPFAEYIPLRDIARRFSDAVDLVTVDMAAGTEVGLIPVTVAGESIPFGVAICFEVAYDEIVAESVRQGAQVLVVPTNNASFGATAESEQQLAMTTFRAVEHGRAAVQVSTVGVSGEVRPNGVVTQRTELFTADQFVSDLPLRTSLTLATKLGVYPQYAVQAVAAALVLLGMATRDRDAGGRRQAVRRS